MHCGNKLLGVESEGGGDPSFETELQEQNLQATWHQPFHVVKTDDQQGAGSGLTSDTPTFFILDGSSSEELSL